MQNIGKVARSCESLHKVDNTSKICQIRSFTEDAVSPETTHTCMTSFFRRFTTFFL